MMKLFKIAFLPLLAGILLLPAASRPVRAAGSAAVEAGAGDRKRDKKKKQEADTAAKATPYEKLFKDKRVETVRGGGLTLHLTVDKLYLELPDSLLGRGLMITTTIEWTGDPGDGLAHQQPVPPYMVEFGRGKSDTLLCMREFAPVVIVDGSPAMREAVGRSNIGPIVASYAVKARTPDGKSSVVDVTALFVGDVKRLRPIDPEGGNTYGGWMTAKADYKKDRSMLTGVTGGKGCVSVVGELSYGTTVSFLGLLDLWKDKPQSIVARRTLRVLGDPERRMRLCDQRLGLAAKAFKRFSDREQEAKTDYYACRRSILDSAGKVRPVVFYVDTAFDASAYAAVERGLLLWNDAFAKIGCKAVCYMADPDVAAAARAAGTTRAVASMDKACGIEGPLIVAVGNAPTALLRLAELMDAGKISPALVVGVPVGFVNVVEAKEELLARRVPAIVARGRKGGSTVAAAIMNALLYEITRPGGPK